MEFKNKSVSGSRNALTALQSFIDDNILNTDSYLQDPEIQNLVNFMMKPREINQYVMSHVHG